MTAERLALLVELLDELAAWLADQDPSFDVAMVSATADIATTAAVALSLEAGR